MLACSLAAVWFASWVALGTRQLNREGSWGALDRFFLWFDLSLLYGVLAVLYGVALVFCTDLLSRVLQPLAARGRLLSPDQRQHAIGALRRGGASIPWVGGPLVLDAAPWNGLRSLLPESLDAGWILLLLGWALAEGCWQIWRRLPMADGALRRHAWLALPTCCLAASWMALWPGQPPPPRELLLSPLPPNADSQGTGGPPGLTLLVIDGADLDDMVLPLVEAGELPTFAKLMAEGTWGPLRSRQPTLSPVLWTSLATGKPLTDHGIRDFVFYHLPGVATPIHRFPRGSGLNHRLFPHLEELSLGFERPPYSRLQRRARPLWDIVGERHTVGVYRWLVTWPAEPVEGFLVAGGVYAGPGDWNPKAKSWLRRMRSRRDNPLESLSLYPPDAMDGMPPFVVERPSDEVLSAFAPQVPLDRRHKHFRLVARSLAEPTAWELPQLIERYRPHFVAASFYAVDAFQHRFGSAVRDGTPWASAVAESYRRTDRQLGRFIESLPPDHHLMVISDHGYDFQLDHHWQAPDGLFLGRGPAFEAARRIEGLGLLDIAPMVLHLLDFPLPEDMPGTTSGRFRRALSGPWRDSGDTLPTYERPTSNASPESLPAALTDEMKDELRSLGYLD